MADAQDKARLIDRIAGSLLARYVRYVRNTSWQTAEMDRIIAANVKHHPCIVAMWHGEFMLLPLIKRPDLPTDIMLARHSDAEFLGEALKRFDMRLIRGAGRCRPGQGPAAAAMPGRPSRRCGTAARWR
jgi:3-deoxy-D-manno-octulosonic-acid transferase